MAPDVRELYRWSNLLLGEMGGSVVVPQTFYDVILKKGMTDISEMNKQLLKIIETFAHNPAHATAIATATATADVTVNIDMVNNFTGDLELLKEELPIYVRDDGVREQMERELKLIHEALEEIKGLHTKSEVKESKPLRRIRLFIDKLENADTNIGKVIKAIDNGVVYARKFAGYYNNIAQWCGLPTVPAPFAK